MELLVALHGPLLLRGQPDIILPGPVHSLPGFSLVEHGLFQLTESALPFLQLLQQCSLLSQLLLDLGRLLQQLLGAADPLTVLLQPAAEGFHRPPDPAELPLIPALVPAQLVKGAVPGLQLLQDRDPLGQRGPLRLPGLLQLKLLRGSLQQALPVDEGLLPLLQLLPLLLLPPGRSGPGSGLPAELVRLGDLLCQSCGGLLIELQIIRQQLPGLGTGQMLRQLPLRTDDLADLGIDGPAQGARRLGNRVTFPEQPLLEPLVALRVEQLLEDCLLLIPLRQQQPLEVALGQHGDAGKLVLVHAQHFLELLVDLARAGDHLAVRHGQGRLDRWLGFAFGIGSAVARHPPDGVLLSAVRKDQLHERLRLGLCVQGAQLLAVVLLAADVPVLAAGAAIESEADGVEDHGLASTGVAGDQVQSPVPQLLQIQHRLIGVGAEGGKGQSQWSHASPSQISSISSRSHRACCSLMGWLFCVS